MENIPRVLTSKLGVSLNAEKWSIPQVYGWLAALGTKPSFYTRNCSYLVLNLFLGSINESELLRTFNCGIGAILIVEKADEENILKIFAEEQEHAVTIGEVFTRSESTQYLLTIN